MREWLRAWNSKRDISQLHSWNRNKFTRVWEETEAEQDCTRKTHTKNTFDRTGGRQDKKKKRKERKEFSFESFLSLPSSLMPSDNFFWTLVLSPQPLSLSCVAEERERELKTDSISYIVWRQGINTQKREKKKYLPLIFSTNCTTTANHSSVTIFRAKPTLTSPEEKASLDFQRSQLRYQEMMETAFSLTAVQDKCERREVTAPLETRGWVRTGIMTRESYLNLLVLGVKKDTDDAF